MSGTVLSASVRQNLLSLQSTADLLAITQNRLATGKKVNSALDNPTNFFTASALDARASDITNLLDGISNGVQVLQAANTGISSLTKLVQSAKATAQQALQSPTAYTTKASIASTVSGLESANLTKLIPSSAVAATSGLGAALAAVTETAASSGASASIAADTAATAAGAAVGTVATSTLLNALTGAGGSTNLAAGDTVTIDGTTITITTATSGTQDATHVRADDTVANLNSAIQLALRDVTNGSGTTSTSAFAANKFTFTASDNSKDITVAGSSAAVLSAIGLTAGTYKPSSAAFASGSVTIGLGTATPTTINFGTGLGQVGNKRDFITALNAITGISATTSGTSSAIGTITIKNGTSTDYRSTLTITGSSNTVLQANLGLTPDVVSGTVATYKAHNFANDNGLAGKSATIQVGTQTAQTINFGAAAGQVSTLAEFIAAVGNAGVTATQNSSQQLTFTNAASNSTQSLTLSGNAFGTGANTLKVAAGTFAPSGNSLNGLSLLVTKGTGTTAVLSTINFGTGVGQIKSLDDLNAKLTADNVGLQAALNSSGTLTFTTTNDNANSTFTIRGSAASAAFGAADAFTNAASSTPVFGGAGDPTRRNLVKDYNSLLGQIDTLAQNSSFNGVNLLNKDDLTLTFNENGTSKSNIKGVDFTSSGLGLNNLASDGSTFLDGSSINKVIDTLDSALGTLRSQASKFGSNLSVVQTRQDFSKSLINVLQTGSANLTLADTNEEAANSQALATRQSIAVSALALANQSQQSVLQLLR